MDDVTKAGLWDSARDDIMRLWDLASDEYKGISAEKERLTKEIHLLNERQTKLEVLLDLLERAVDLAADGGGPLKESPEPKPEPEPTPEPEPPPEPVSGLLSRQARKQNNLPSVASSVREHLATRPGKLHYLSDIAVVVSKRTTRANNKNLRSAIDKELRRLVSVGAIRTIKAGSDWAYEVVRHNH